MQFPKPEFLHPYPNGWYVIERSDNLKKGVIMEKKFMGQEIVLFRLEDGTACASTAFCPHLGAHFAHGGSVQGNCIRCPFHNFEFDSEGTCTKTGYSTKPPPKAKLQMYELREVNEMIILWHHDRIVKPDWEVPAISFEGWGAVVSTDWKLRSHPQETTENSVDIGHFATVHGYKQVEILNDPIVEGPILSAEYAMHRKAGFLGKKNELIRIEFAAKAYGLGYSFVETHIPKYDLRTRHYVFSTPIEGNYINLKIGMSLKHIDKPSKIHPLLSIIPKKLIEMFILNAAFKGYKHDVSQDFKIWENKIYITPPALAKGDGPVWQYREWAQQFYNKENASSSAVSMEEATI